VRRVIPALGLAFLAPVSAWAADPWPAQGGAPGSMSATTSPAPPSVGSAPVSSPTGLGVLALAGATEAAWPLAQAVYADVALRPTAIDEAHARVLCGEPPPPGDPDLHDLADTVAAIHGDDAPSRLLLSGLLNRFGARGIVVVRPPAPPAPASARVFLGAADAFDAATYTTDDPAAGGASPPAPSWSQALQSLQRTYSRTGAPVLATHPTPPADASPRHFYESGWFWGAIGLAALSAGAVFFLTRDSSSPTIHLDAQVPHG